VRLESISQDGPKVVKTMFSPAAITIRFPSGDEWEYVIYDDATLRQLLRSHRKNVGRLVSNLRRFESQKVKDGPERQDNPTPTPAPTRKTQLQLF
jgi:hypothetical protein